MGSFWNRDALTIVIVPDKKLLENLSPIINEWSREGLLGPFFLTSPDQLIEKSGEPSRLNASIWSEVSGEVIVQSLDALEQMAQFEFKTVRILSLRVLAKNATFNEKENVLIAKICDLIYKALPMAVNVASMSEQVTRLMKINLVISPSEMPEQSNDLAFAGNWDMHFIASPEDRSTPWTADALVRADDERFPRFALLHAATIGGFWNGLGISPIELIDREEASQHGKWVGRIFVNAILTDGLSRRVSAKVLEEIAGASRDIYDTRVAINIPGTKVIPPDEVSRWVDWTVQHVFILEDGALEFMSPHALTAPAKANWMEWDQIKSFLKFSWDKLKKIPWWMWIWVRRRIGRSLTQTFHSDQGLADVGISQSDPLDQRDLQLAEKLVRIKSMALQASAAMNSAPPSQNSRSTPRLWSGIRRLVFGMLDGSDLTDFGLKPTAENEGRVPVFASTAQLIVDPSEHFEIPSGMQEQYRAEKVSWEDLEQLSPIIADTRNQILGVQNLLDSHLATVAAVKDEISQINVRVRGF